MRIHTLTLLALTLAGCGGNSSPADMQHALPDMTAIPVADLTMPASVDAGTGCLTIITCASGCGGKAACAQACANNGTSAAQMLYNALFACAYAGCLSLPDGGAPDGGPMIESPDGGGPPCASLSDSSATCTNCVSKVAQSSECSAQLGACLNN